MKIKEFMNQVPHCSYSMTHACSVLLTFLNKFSIKKRNSNVRFNDDLI